MIVPGKAQRHKKKQQRKKIQQKKLNNGFPIHRLSHFIEYKAKWL
jgi:hypothetical protein